MEDDTKHFSMCAVFGVTSHVLLVERGMDEIHDVFDFFCPGIFTHQLPLAVDAVRKEIHAQFPEAGTHLQENPIPSGADALDAWVVNVKEKFPDGFTLRRKIIPPKTDAG